MKMGKILSMHCKYTCVNHISKMGMAIHHWADVVTVIYHKSTFFM